MTVLHTYAMLNENDICYGFTKLPKKYKKEDTPPNLVWLPDENDTYLYRKYDRQLGAFSQEKFEPDTDFELLERIDSLEEENENLKNQVSQLSDETAQLNQTINVLNGSIVELTELLATLGGAE